MGSLSIHHPRRARTDKWDPPPVDEFGTFLRGSSNHQVLRLVNVKFFGGNAQLGKKSVQLPHLTELILAELIEPVGLGGLFLFLTRLNANASISTSIPSRRSSPTPKSRYGLPPPSKNPLRGARTPSRSSCSAAAGTPSPRRGLRKTKLGLDEANNDPHSTSPSAAPAKDWPMSSAGERLLHTPVWSWRPSFRASPPRFSKGWNVVEIKANVVNRYLRRLGRMMAPRESETWSFNALETIRLRAIPKKRQGAMPDASDRCSLEQFVGRIRKQRYGVDRDEPVLESRDSISIALEGRFGIEIETGELLGEGDRLWCIEIKHLGGCLVYGGAEGEEENEEEEKVEGVNGVQEDKKDEEDGGGSGEDAVHEEDKLEYA